MSGKLLKNVYIPLIHSCLHMAEKSSGTGQWKKLFFNKYLSDTKGVIWKISPTKVLLWMLSITIILILTFSFFQEDQTSYLRNVLFYSIIIMIIMMIAWVVAMFVLKSRKLFIGFIIAWILILGLYIVLGAVFSFVGWMDFHYGLIVWIVISCLAGLGAKRIDGSLDKNDVFFGMLVLIVLVIGNVPIFESGGFFAQVDNLINFVSSKLSFIDLEDLLAS